MTNLDAVMAWVHERLPELARLYDVPGVGVAVSVGDDVRDCVFGVLSKATGVDVTRDSVFQIGSITKLWTSTLIMQLVDEGLLELDAPVREYLPEFALRDESAAATVTLRDLLTHVGGFEGNVFTDTGVGDDCLSKYVDALADVPQVSPPGTMFSYNNAGFSILGRIVEKVRGTSFDNCLRSYLFAPLGLTQAAADPYEAILRRAAVGHLLSDGAGWQPTPVWALPRSLGPAGAMLAMSPRELVAFGRLYVNDGVADSGERVLSSQSVAQMQQWQVSTPWVPTRLDPHIGWGLGWILLDWPGNRVIGHDGAALGQRAFLRVVPTRAVTVAVLTNGGNAIPLNEALTTHILRELADVRVPPNQTLPELPERVDGTRYVGTYDSRMYRATVSQDTDGRMWLDQTPAELAETLQEHDNRMELVRLYGDSFVTVDKYEGVHLPYTFVGDDGSGHALYLHDGSAARRV